MRLVDCCGFSGRYNYHASLGGYVGICQGVGKIICGLGQSTIDQPHCSLVRILCLAQVFQHFFLLLVLNYGQNHFDDINSILFHEFT